MQPPISFQRILFAGASVRWACQAAQAAGFTCVAADLFADQDTRQACESVHQLSRFEELPTVAKKVRPDAIVPLGGLENHPDIVSQLSSTFPFLGTDPISLQRVLNIDFLKSVFQDQFPETSTELPPNGEHSHWLAKQINRAGGGHVQVLADADKSRLPKGSFFQRLCPGLSYGATFCTSTSTTSLLGVTLHIEPEAFGYRRFQYAGLIGPIPLSSSAYQRIEALGQQLASQCSIRGLFGLDLVSTDSDFADAKVVDVNLRIPASAELLQSTQPSSTNLISLHIQSALGQTNPAENKAFSSESLQGKLILYNGSLQWKWTDEKSQKLDTELSGNFADVPVSNSVIEPHAPIVTLFAEGSSINTIMAQLKTIQTEAQKALGIERS